MDIRVLLATAVSGTLLTACASAPPQATHKSAPFKAAVQVRNLPPAKAPPQPIPTGTVVGPRLSKYAIVERLPLRSPVGRVAAANRASLHEPVQRDYVNAVQVYPYADDALYRLYAAPEQVTDIALQPGETLSAISAGDTVRWTVGNTTSGQGPNKQVHVLVKPFSAGLKTNLVILTDRHTYHLELESTDHVSMAAISWRYPNEGMIKTIGQQPAPTPEPTAIGSDIALNALDFGYAITGDDPPWRPVRTFDDGRKVYIEFPKDIAETQSPPLFVVGQNGGSDLVNYRVRGRYYIVDRLFQAAELRLGESSQQVVRIIRTDRKDGSASSLFGG
ncbi:MAG: P-type conjugative transfer protein TrbG [Alphaproteobacteria bacterium]|nr:P-type conjugative transfer protein TrbG [Alphaproteobacteria bacterium]MDE2111524.1 P-type conjugative transfer protein TrbG [Alphaproteobacteria bacterium]MDE2494968.1 P-type conjugative transfer protein TrbG [Alphaproteobacteria bacterium]